jgi:hypothetical protein
MNTQETICLAGTPQAIAQIKEWVKLLNSNYFAVEDITGEYLELWVRDQIRKRMGEKQ